ncbi:apidaecins type 73-like [Solea solea]|uniref:apidaecins type 73-like n=1 Tax=Solea solea TaxID=90069 RepID=UPI002729EBF7|nr:apidaecins type 73-like [Solea solea]
MKRKMKMTTMTQEIKSWLVSNLLQLNSLKTEVLNLGVMDSTHIKSVSSTLSLRPPPCAPSLPEAAASSPRPPHHGLLTSASRPRPPHLGLLTPASSPRSPHLGLPTTASSPRSPHLGLPTTASSPRPPHLGLLTSVSSPRPPDHGLLTSASRPRPPHLGLLTPGLLSIPAPAGESSASLLRPLDPLDVFSQISLV